MKNRNAIRLMAWALVMVMPLWFSSCKKSDDAVAPAISTVEGSWQISGYKIDPVVDLFQTGKKSNDLLLIYKSSPYNEDKDFVECLSSIIITFNSDGKATEKAGPKCTANMGAIDDNSTWKVDGNKLIITNGTDVTTYDMVISGNTLTMSIQILEDLDYDGKKETYTTTLELLKV